MNKSFQFAFLIFLFVVNQGLAQCPGCVINLPTLPEDTVFITNPDPGQVGLAYDEDISFRLPKTTATVDPSIQPPLNISSIEIVSVTNIPPGLTYEANQTSFDPQSETDGCVKFCGTPLVSDSFYVNVVVDASVIIFTQTTSFAIPFYIAPANTVTDGFSMTNNTACGETTVDFTNNVAGQDGVSFFWDFGNGMTSTEENPPSVNYNEAGSYTVTYEATIDTLGYFLNTVNVDGVGCTDLIGPPDIYLKIFDPTGTEIYLSETISSEPPLSFSIPSLSLEGGNYSVQVLDDDPFAQVNCGSVNFNFGTEGTLLDGDLELTLDIFNPTSMISSEGIVTVLPVPDAPVISPADVAEQCVGNTVNLEIAASENIEWFQDTAVIIGANASVLEVTTSGSYYAVYTNAEGCTATSESVAVNFVAIPENPIFAFSENELTLVNPQNLPDNFTLQWYLNGEPLVDETGQVICMMESGDYALEVLDLTTGCTNTYDNYQVFFPGEGCATSAISDLIVNDIRLFPNPATDLIQIDIPEINAGVATIFDMRGAVIWQDEIDLRTPYSLNVSDFVDGFYLLKIEQEGEIWRKKFVVY